MKDQEVKHYLYQVIDRVTFVQTPYKDKEQGGVLRTLGHRNGCLKAGGNMTRKETFKKEAITSRNEKEVATCIRDLNAPGKDMDRDLLAELLINLTKFQKEIITQDSLLGGERCTKSSIGCMLARLLLENGIPYNEVWLLIYEGGEAQGQLVEIEFRFDMCQHVLGITISLTEMNFHCSSTVARPFRNLWYFTIWVLTCQLHRKRVNTQPLHLSLSFSQNATSTHTNNICLTPCLNNKDRERETVKERLSTREMEKVRAFDVKLVQGGACSLHEENTTVEKERRETETGETSHSRRTPTAINTSTVTPIHDYPSSVTVSGGAQGSTILFHANSGGFRWAVEHKPWRSEVPWFFRWRLRKRVEKLREKGTGVRITVHLAAINRRKLRGMLVINDILVAVVVVVVAGVVVCKEKKEHRGSGKGRTDFVNVGGEYIDGNWEYGLD
ncbi:LOW QUALITY PROTEIN: hypothetical protein M8C21_017238 [Ambrosia artemisiifolia]|uniref:Uncharacterized protein n=1 Tax=Ambrosia artemisiifolia TaxID=4212 RepID=A0AAD5CPT2_AMBAR|nr:LOW QUALITY PROTEIN: hypothetical protein M8C21_017238 [Ambrosia artemisiifolia]